MKTLCLAVAMAVLAVLGGCKITHNINHKTPTENTVKEVPAPPEAEELTELED